MTTRKFTRGKDPVRAMAPVLIPARTFTLVELLVVITIISILAGLMLPAMGSAMAMARNTQCKNNERQLGLCMGQYESDYNVLPAAGGPGPFGDYFFWNSKLFQAGLLSVGEPQYWGAMANNCPLLNCPANQEPIISNYGFGTHLANLMGVPDNANHQNWCETFLKRNRISKPYMRLLLGDATYPYLGGGQVTYPTLSSSPNGNAWYPHKNRMNILYLDWHVNSLSEADMTLDWHFYQPLFGNME